MNYAREDIDALTYEIVGAAIHVHKELGPGLLESIYQQCLEIELIDRGFIVEREFTVPVLFKERELETSLKVDLLVNKTIVIELKAVKELLPVFDAQILTYMKLLKAPKGILLNFYCSNIFHNGQKTFVNERYFELQ